MTTNDTPTPTADGSAAPFALTAGELPPVLAADLALADVTPTLTLGGGFPKERNGKPCFYWDKEAIGPGTIRDVKGVVHRLTPKDIDAIVDDVTKAMSFGHEPSLPPTHFGPTHGINFGWVKGIRKNAKGNIVLTHQHVGADENSRALNNKTSVMLRRDYTDERGRQWRWWLDHNAVIPNPQLRDLEDFKPSTLAASSDGQPAPVDYVVLAADTGALPQETPMSWTKTRAAIGDAAKDVPDEKMDDHAAGHIDKCHARMKKAGMSLSASDDADPVLLGLSALRDTFEESNTQGKDNPAVLALAAETIGSMAQMQRQLADANLALSAAEQARDDAILLSAAEPAIASAEVDPRIMALSQKDAERAIVLAEARDVVTPSQANWLRERKKAKPELALSGDAEDATSPVDDFIAFAALANNAPVPAKPIPRGAVPAKPTKAAMALSGDPDDPNAMTDEEIEAEQAKERGRYSLPSPK